MTYNFWLRVWVENYIDMALTNTMRILYTITFENWYETIVSSITITFFSLVVLYPILAIVMIFVKRS